MLGDFIPLHYRSCRAYHIRGYEDYRAQIMQMQLRADTTHGRIIGLHSSPPPASLPWPRPPCGRSALPCSFDSGSGYVTCFGPFNGMKETVCQFGV